MTRMKSKKRISWDEYFMKLAMLIAERSTCLRHHVGAVIVRDKRILTTGYNGAVSGLNSCLELDCLRNKLKIASGTRQEICRAVHAEQNAIIQAGLHGINIKDTTLYITHTPCIICAKMIANAGIKRIVTFADYPDKNALVLLNQKRIRTEKIARPSTTISVLE
jgi:dCMP deaminase